MGRTDAADEKSRHSRRHLFLHIGVVVLCGGISENEWCQHTKWHLWVAFRSPHVILTRSPQPVPSAPLGRRR